ncbi:hypothetical protein CPB86DRAFT_28961 [Serendipita vermifera]|nr:hypothetical protein CPB86DRAFT_28961 [Serendipita vermifera]
MIGLAGSLWRRRICSFYSLGRGTLLYLVVGLSTIVHFRVDAVLTGFTLSYSPISCLSL